MLKCPNCGAPLQAANQAAQRSCVYCGALLQVPSAAPPPVAPLYAPAPLPATTARTGSRVVLVASVLVLLGIALPAGLATFRSVALSLGAPAAPAPTLGSVPAAEKPALVAWNRLETIDIHASTDQAKVLMKQQFPEAKVDQEKEYNLNLDHPILGSVMYPWDWGCACLERAVFYFKDYPTRMKTQEAFIPCLVRGLGPLTTSAPPFDYEWAPHGDTPRVHLGPQTLSISLDRSTSEATYQRLIRVLGDCRN